MSESAYNPLQKYLWKKVFKGNDSYLYRMLNRSWIHTAEERYFAVFLLESLFFHKELQEDYIQKICIIEFFNTMFPNADSKLFGERGELYPIILEAVQRASNPNHREKFEELVQIDSENLKYKRNDDRDLQQRAQYALLLSTASDILEEDGIQLKVALDFLAAIKNYAISKEKMELIAAIVINLMHGVTGIPGEYLNTNNKPGNSHEVFALAKKRATEEQPEILPKLAVLKGPQSSLFKAPIYWRIADGVEASNNGYTENDYLEEDRNSGQICLPNHKSIIRPEDRQSMLEKLEVNIVLFREAANQFLGEIVEKIRQFCCLFFSTTSPASESAAETGRSLNDEDIAQLQAYHIEDQRRITALEEENTALKAQHEEQLREAQDRIHQLENQLSEEVSRTLTLESSRQEQENIQKAVSIPDTIRHYFRGTFISNIRQQLAPLLIQIGQYLEKLPTIALPDTWGEFPSSLTLKERKNGIIRSLASTPFTGEELTHLCKQINGQTSELTASADPAASPSEKLNIFSRLLSTCGPKWLTNLQEASHFILMSQHPIITKGIPSNKERERDSICLRTALIEWISIFDNYLTVSFNELETLFRSQDRDEKSILKLADQITKVVKNFYHNYYHNFQTLVKESKPRSANFPGTTTNLGELYEQAFKNHLVSHENYIKILEDCIEIQNSISESFSKEDENIVFTPRKPTSVDSTASASSGSFREIKTEAEAWERVQTLQEGSQHISTAPPKITSKRSDSASSSSFRRSASGLRRGRSPLLKRKLQRDFDAAEAATTGYQNSVCTIFEKSSPTLSGHPPEEPNPFE